MKLIGNTFLLKNTPTIQSFASIVGKKEGEGPLGEYFDLAEDDAHFGQDTWEKAESELIRRTVLMAINKGGYSLEEIDFMFAGDLLNQCIGTTYGLREMNIPFLGLYGACSTMSESLLLS